MKLRKIYDILTLGIALIAMALLSAACGEEREVVPVVNPDDMQISLLLTVGADQDAALSRAPSEPDGGYDAGEGYENWINLDDGDFRFWIFDADNNTYIAPIDFKDVIQVEQTEFSKTYRIIGKVNRDMSEGGFDPGSQSFKVMVVANWGTYPEPSVGDHIDDIVAKSLNGFSPDNNIPSAGHPIPLYGIKKYTPVTFDATNVASLGRIHLLRAFAKIEVKAAPLSETLKSVNLTRYNSQSYFAPAKVYDETDYVHNDYDLDYVNVPNIPANSTVVESLPFKKASDGSFVIYVPEYDNLRLPQEAAQIKLRFEKTDHEYLLQFRDYSSPTGKSFNLLRNYWYRYTVNKQDTVVEVQLVPYNEITLRPEFGLDDEIDGYTPIYDENNNIIYYYDSLTGTYYQPTSNGLQPIENPYFQNIDPGTGYRIIRDEFTGLIMFYQNLEENIYYLPDKKTRVYDPYKDSALSPSARYHLVIRRDNNLLVYYHDRNTGRIYAPDETTEITTIFSTKYSGIIGMRIPAKEENGQLIPAETYFLNSKDKKYYREQECVNEVTPAPFPTVTYTPTN